MCRRLSSHMATLCVCASAGLCADRWLVLLSPSTVLIKASGGRQKGWTEREKRRKRYACMTPWFMWWRKRAREGEGERTEHQTSFHLRVSAHTAQNVLAVSEQEVCKLLHTTQTYVRQEHMNSLLFSASEKSLFSSLSNLESLMWLLIFGGKKFNQTWIHLPLD